MTDSRFNGAIGTDYDLFKLAVPHHDEFEDEVGKIVKEYAKAHPEKEILTVFEIGCGTGITTKRILLADPRINVIAADSDEHMRAVAAKNLIEFRGRVIFKGDAASAIAPLKKTWRDGGWLDIVASAYTMHNFKYDYRRVLTARAASNLRSGGLFVNADKYGYSDIILHWRSLKHQIDAFEVFKEHGRQDLWGEWTRHYLEDEQNKFTEEDERVRLAEYGFTNIQTAYRKGMEAVIAATKK